MAKKSDERREADEQVDAMLEDVKVFNPHTGQWETPGPEDAYRVDEHEAQVKGEPAPGDRTEADMKRLEASGGVVAPSGPVVTAASPNETPGVNTTGNRGERTTTGNAVV